MKQQNMSPNNNSSSLFASFNSLLSGANVRRSGVFIFTIATIAFTIWMLRSNRNRNGGNRRVAERRQGQEQNRERQSAAPSSTSSGKLFDSSSNTLSISKLVNRKVTLTTNEIIFQNSGNYSLIPETVPVICQLAQVCDLYLITMCQTDEEEKRVNQSLTDAGVFDSGLNKYKSLFHSTIPGRASMLRQLEPHLHIDNSPAVAEPLLPFIPEIVCIRQGESSAQSLVRTVSDIASLFQV